MHDRILQRSAELKQRLGGNDPYELAQVLNIHLLEKNNFKRLKGMYCIIQEQRFIFLNASLSEEEKRIVLAHEIGHDQFHRDLAKENAFQEFMLYDMRTQPEYEANLFAADFLLEEEEILAWAKEGYDVPQIASLCKTDINLLLIKLHKMEQRGTGILR